MTFQAGDRVRYWNAEGLDLYGHAGMGTHSIFPLTAERPIHTISGGSLGTVHDVVPSSGMVVAFDDLGDLVLVSDYYLTVLDHIPDLTHREEVEQWLAAP